jgi:hypothetical protein
LGLPEKREGQEEEGERTEKREGRKRVRGNLALEKREGKGQRGKRNGYKRKEG